SALGVFQFQLTFPRRFPILVGPDLDQNQLVTEVSQVLQGLLVFAVIEKIRNYQHQASLRIPDDQLKRAFEEVGAPIGFQCCQIIRSRLEAVTAAADEERIV